MNKLFLIFISTFLLNHSIKAQTKINSFIQDSLTNEYLPYASVCTYNSSYKQCYQSNQYGYIQFPIQTITDSLIIRYIGYKDKVIYPPFEIKDSVFMLSPIVVQMSGVEINAQKRMSEHNVLNIPIEKLKNIPTMAGEPDVLKALSYFPGVQTGTEGTNGLYVRGGTPDQNLILLDGTTVYNTAHLFGFMSNINPYVVKNIKLYKGNFPARYGGRLSAVIDINTKEGSTNKKKLGYSIGLLNSNLVAEGPMEKVKGASYCIGARIGSLGLVTLPGRIQFELGKKDEQINYLMYDFNAKLAFDISPTSKLFFSTYQSNDNYALLGKFIDITSKTAINWGNNVASIRYFKILKKNIFWNNIVAFNRYYYRYTIKSNFEKNNLESNFSTANKVVELTAKSYVDWILDDHSVKIGIEATQSHFLPNVTKATIQQESLDSTFQFSVGKINPFQFSFFAEDEYKVNKNLSFMYGLRQANYWVKDTSYHSLEPRVGAHYELSPLTAIELGYSFMKQPVHLLTNYGIGGNNDLWLSSTARVSPQVAHQVSLGYSAQNESNSLIFQTDVYAKFLANQIDFLPRKDLFFSNNSNWEDLIAKNGIGRVYGWEMMLQKDDGFRNFILSYALSYNLRKFTTINNGKWYPQKNEQRHTLSILWENDMYNQKWRFFANFIIHSGTPISLPVGLKYDFVDNNYYEVYSDRNNQRMPWYNRFDIGFTRNIITKKGKKGKLVFSVYNVYAYPNPIAINYRRILNFGVDQETIESFEPRVFKTVPFRLIPGINYQIGL